MEPAGIGFCQASCVIFLFHESTTVEPHRTGPEVRQEMTGTFYIPFIYTGSP